MSDREPAKAQNAALWSLIEQLEALLAEAERRGAEKGWDSARESFAADFLKPVDEYGMRAVSPNPYRKGADR